MGFQRNLFLLLIAVLLIAATPEHTLTQSRAGGSPPPGTARSAGRLADAVTIADVIWNSQANVVVTGNTIRKISGCSGCPDAGAISQQSITSGDGLIEFTALETDRLRFAGLSFNDPKPTYDTLRFSIKLTNFGVAEVRELNHTYKAETRYQANDVFRIAVESGVVRYYRNGKVFYTSKTPPAYPLFFDASIVSTGGTIANARISAGAPPPPVDSPLVISAVSAGNVTTNSATITWTTNAPSSSQVEYGASTNYGSQTATDSTLVTSHSVTLTGLSAATLYHFRVKSKTATGQPVASADFTFTTGSITVGDGPVITDKKVYPEPPPPALPAAGGTFTDPVFKTTLMRVTDASDGQFNNTNYSYWPNFNKNSTRLYIISNGKPTLYDFDPVNFRIAGKRALFAATLPNGSRPDSEDAIWSGLEPDEMLCHDGLKLWSYNVAKNSYQLLRDFTPEYGSGLLWQMSRSIDDNVFAFTVKNSSYQITGYLVWTRAGNKVYRVSTTDLDEVQIDKTGRYLVVKTNQSGHGTIQVRVVDLVTQSVENLIDDAPDYAPGHSDCGRGFVIGADNWNNRLLYRNLSAPHIFYSVIDWGNDWSQSGHSSMMEDDDLWILNSSFKANDLPSTGLFKNEIYLIATDGSQRVRRLAHHHSVYREYWDTPRATISRDGRFIVFTSNWGSTRRDVFIVKVPGR